MHQPGAPGCRSSGCDNSSVGVVRLREKYFEARAPSCFVPETRRVSVPSEPGPQWRLLLCGWCICHAVPYSGSRPCSPWLPCGAPFEGSRPAPMMRCSAFRGSALRCLVTSRHGNRGHLSLVRCPTVTGGPSLPPATGLMLGTRRSYKIGVVGLSFLSNFPALTSSIA